jgi:c-di-GMP-binding flagellar brake protein YcgR
MFNNNALIKDKLEIFNLLKNIQKSKQLIALSFESLPQYCLTSLLDVHHDAKILMFDEPNPQLSDKLAKTKNEATLSLKLDNLPVLFKTELISKDFDKLNNDLCAHFPKEIYYPQNRHYYRFSTENINEINTTVFLSSAKKLPGQLINISLNGLCLRLPYSFAAMFQIGQYIDDIYIELPNQSGFSISAKVQNSRIENNYNNIALGLQIYQPKTSIEKIIQQFIFCNENT